MSTYTAIFERAPDGTVWGWIPEMPARLRDAQHAQYAILVGAAFGNVASLDDELREHAIALWTVDDLATCLREQFGPLELQALMSAGRIADRLSDLQLSVEHGERKRVAVVAEILHRSLWTAQKTLATSVPPAETPIFTDDTALLMVDEALSAAGAVGGVQRATLARALELLESRNILARSADRGIVAVVPPTIQSP